MTGWRDLSPRLAGPLSRRPLRIAIAALLVGALGAIGLLRFAVDAGQSLLVGSGSSAGQTYTGFANTFGSDPIVLVFSARNPSAPYFESNLQRLGALEVDLSHDPRVASVLGPGTVAGSLREAAVAEVSKVLAEYPYFIAESELLGKATNLQQQLQAGAITQAQYQQQLQQLSSAASSDVSTATALLEAAVVAAANDAHTARSQYTEKPGDLVLDSREKTVDATVANDQQPPLWAEYLAGPGQTTNPAAAQQFFAKVSAAYGDCDDQIASLLKVQPSCQVFFQRTLLDLPTCPPVSSKLYCSAKPQWAAVLPRPRPGGATYAIVTVRLKPQYVGNQSELSSLQDKITAELAHGIASDAYTKSLPAASLSALKSIGALSPTECGGITTQQGAACAAALHDAPLKYVMAGAPLLGLGVVRSMTQLLVILFPVALFVMLLLLAGTFRVRGRVWPLVAAVATTVLTVGIALLTGTPITPAVLAGVPVLLGLGVDYAVQLVARFSEERGRGSDAASAIQRVLDSTAQATLIAAVTTLAGLAALALLAGVDWGPLVAVPLVAEFALVLCGGVVLAWLGGLFIALPLAVWSDARRPAVAGVPATGDAAGPGRDSVEAPRARARTAAIADRWRAVVALAMVLALAGWGLLFLVPVQTDVQHLVSPRLAELNNVETVQRETGYTNEIDVYVRGKVATGPLNMQTGVPVSVEWQCGVDAKIRSKHPDTVAQATSIGDYVVASTSGSASSASKCAPPASTPATPAPSPSASPLSSPSATSSPTSARSSGAGALPAARVIPAEAAATAAPSPTAAPPAAAPTATPRASPSATPAPSSAATPQTPFLCDLRLLPALSRTLAMPIGMGTTACPAIDEYRSVFLSMDQTPINPTSARIAIGVHTDTVAEQARLVESLRAELANPPNGLRADPTGLAVLATTAYDNLVNRAYLLNLAPLAVVAIVLFAIYRERRRVLLPLLPTALAAGWAPLLLLLLGRLPGGAGSTLGSFNPLTVVLGALIVALGTEFGVVLIGRFYEERGRGLDPDAAAGAALAGVGRAIRVSALTLGAGFAVLAVSGVFPNSLPLVADFGLAVVIDLTLAVGAVFLVMLPLAVALERTRPLAIQPAMQISQAAPTAVARAIAQTAARPAAEPQAGRKARARRRAATSQSEAEPLTAAEQPEPEPQPQPAPPAQVPALPGADTTAVPHRSPGVSGRRRPPAPPEPEPAPATASVTPPDDEIPAASRRGPGVSGRRRQPQAEPAASEEAEPARKPRPGVSGRKRRR